MGCTFRLKSTVLGLVAFVASGCTNMIESLEGSISLVSTSPSVPSNDPDGRILIKGTSWDNVSGVDLYSDSACSNLLSRVTSAEFSQGIVLNWPTNTEFDVHARPRFADDTQGICKFLFTYSNDTTAPDNPSFVGFSVNNGAAEAISSINLSENPHLEVVGSFSDPSAKLIVASDSSCQTVIGQGSAQEFHSTGVELSPAYVGSIKNAGLVSIYGQAQDPAGNLSSCVLLSNLLYDTIAPSLTVSVPSGITIVSGCNQNVTVSGLCGETGQYVVVSLPMSGSVATQTVTCAAGSYSANLTFIASKNGSHAPQVATSDLAGNTTTINSTSSYYVNDCGGALGIGEGDGVAQMPSGDLPLD
jgi:hypothetical protein